MVRATVSSPVLVALFTFCTVVIHKLMNLFGHWRSKQQGPMPPGPKPLPIIGSLHKTVFSNKPASQWIHGIMNEMNTEIASVRLGKVNVIAVTCPDLAHEFLCKQDRIFSSRPIQMSTEISTYGYLTTALGPLGAQWRKMRKIIISEMLSPARHRWLESKRMEEANNLTRYVQDLCSSCGRTVNVRVIAQQHCANNIRRIIFNKRFIQERSEGGGPEPEEIEHVEALFTVLRYANAYSISDCLPWLRLFDLDGHKKIIRKAVETIKRYHDPVIDRRICLWREDGIKKSEEDVLDVFIQLKDSNGAPLLTPNEIKAQIIDLMIAGIDNPSNAVEWALAEMINQPGILQKAVEELDMVVGKDRQVQELDLPRLNYVKACIKEAFRLHPLAPFNVPHVSTTDTNVAGYFIPKGSHVLLSRHGLGRNPKSWEDPLKFKPERHINADRSEVVLTDPKLRLFTFGTGTRGCPGVVLGTTVTTMLLARLLHGFTWSAPPNVSRRNLSEPEQGFSLVEPLLAFAKPRLPQNLYHMA